METYPYTTYMSVAVSVGLSLLSFLQTELQGNSVHSKKLVPVHQSSALFDVLFVCLSAQQNQCQALADIGKNTHVLTMLNRLHALYETFTPS